LLTLKYQVIMPDAQQERRAAAKMDFVPAITAM
jgi:hypothetical protein